MSTAHRTGGRQGRSRGGAHEEEHENHERWAVSYADMMTVLVGLFIVLYAMSQVDQVKFEALRDSLAQGFGNASANVLDGSAGVMKDAGAVPNSPQASGETGPIQPVIEGVPGKDPNVELAKQEVTRLQQMQAEIEARLAAVGMAQQVRYRIDERGLVVGLVADDVFFDPASAALKPAAQAVLDAAAPLLVAIPEEISVEGHANIIPVSGRYASNWELSADRATQVLRRLVETGGVPGRRISAIGFGDTRPLPDPDGDPLEVNRRVDIVIHSAVPEPVRALVPSVIAGTEG
ncbi:flagellar motor protein MotB [Cellulomonas fimi]|uniref:Flagellar motor protein MotB n=1 Tax=Cellulomonas fimi TaxID=1708 RepID=A0A7Y0QHE4_CELFI|nr:flagellar motor protein MotB [Cellulomonas fimi]NMR21061.1 flagellar motor protein MotB [Cellulomonas fimi]